MNHVVFIFICLSASICSAQTEKKISLGEQPIYKAKKALTTITVDGKLNKDEWVNAEVRTLDYFYRIEQASDQQKTTFRMLWDEHNIYLFYKMKDKYLTARETQRDGEPYLDDCAEIFFITAPDSLDTHFGFELNLNKASNDFIYFNDFYQEKSIAFKVYNPDFEVEVSYNGSINNNTDIDEGWCIEMAIPISNFGALGTVVPIAAGSRWAFLAIRQDRNDAEGNRRSTSTIFPIYDISKNVHQANRFGLVEFVDQ